MSIKISIVDDFSSIFAGTKKLGQAFDDVADSLDDIPKDAQDAARVIDARLKDAADSAEDAAKTTKQKFSDAFDTVRKDSKTTGDDLGTSFKRGSEEASEGTKAFKENAGANFKEVGASFDGTVDGMADGLQGFIAEATEGFGPLGLAAGAAVAIGIGILESKLQAAADRINQMKEQAGQLAIAWRDATDDADLVQALNDQWDDLTQRIVDNKSWFEFWQKDAVTAVDRLATAMKTDAPTVGAFWDAFNVTDPIERQEELAAAVDQARRSAAEYGQQIDALTAKQQRQGSVVSTGGKALDDWTDADEAALAAARAHKSALEGIIPTMSDEAQQAAATATELEALAAVHHQTVAEYKATQQAAKDTADAQAAAADKAKQAAADRQAALESEDQAYRTTLASAADLGTLLGDAWADPNSPLRKWADGQAKATKSADDTWADFQDRATPAQALQAVMDEMDAKIAADAAFTANLKDLAARGFGALVEDLRQGGADANGAIVQALRDGTDDTVQAFAKDRGTLTGKSLIQGASAAFSNDPALQQAVNDAVSKVTPPNITFAAKVSVDDSEVRRWAANPIVVTAVARVGRPQVN